mgnify:CR=1 FL=1
MPNFEYEKSLAAKGYQYICGIDEAGRGPLAGPVFAAAVYVPLAAAKRLAEDSWNAINDSKKLSPRKREHLRTKPSAFPLRRRIKSPKSPFFR